MRKERSESWVLACWDDGLDTAAIAEVSGIPEAMIDALLWRLREQRRRRRIEQQQDGNAA